MLYHVIDDVVSSLSREASLHSLGALLAELFVRRARGVPVMVSSSTLKHLLLKLRGLACEYLYAEAPCAEVWRSRYARWPSRARRLAHLRLFRKFVVHPKKDSPLI